MGPCSAVRFCAFLLARKIGRINRQMILCLRRSLTGLNHCLLWARLPEGEAGSQFDSASAIVPLAMFEDFTVTDRWTKKPVHCIYQALIVAIATRHADAVDIKFLVDGKPVWVALPHPAWVEYKKRTGRMVTDSLAVEIAGHYLKSALEAGEGLGREMYSLTVEETLEHIDAVVAAMQSPVPA